AFPWAFPILADRDWFLERLQTFPGGFFWDEAVQDWQELVSVELAALELLPEERMAGGEEWGPAMGPVEYRLHRELRRRWLIWRDEVIRGGTVAPAAVHEELLRRQRGWERSAHPAHGTAPVEMVRREREGSGG
ncbi:MAG: hypothetical protein ACRDHY_15440, partial [Anaerolineales bacterium]